MKKTRKKVLSSAGAYITQLKLIQFWKQKNMQVGHLSVLHFWTKVAGFCVDDLEAMWNDIDDPMDIDEEAQLT